MGGLADTRIYKEVATAKLTIKQNPICSWYVRGGGRGQPGHGDGRTLTLGRAPIRLNSIYSLSGQNMARQHTDRFCMPHCFDVSHGIGICLDMIPVPLERLYPLSFPSLQRMSKMKSVCHLGDDFGSDCPEIRIILSKSYLTWPLCVLIPQVIW
jgi:hypothetical protein